MPWWEGVSLVSWSLPPSRGTQSHTICQEKAGFFSGWKRSLSILFIESIQSRVQSYFGSFSDAWQPRLWTTPRSPSTQVVKARMPSPLYTPFSHGHSHPLEEASIADKKTLKEAISNLDQEFRAQKGPDEIYGFIRHAATLDLYMFSGYIDEWARLSWAKRTKPVWEYLFSVWVP